MSGGTVEAIYRLSHKQRGMLFETLRPGSDGAYLEQLSFPLQGPLDVSAFRAAWQQVFDRHSALRTALVWRSRDEPLQVVLHQVPVPLRELDWRSVPAADQPARLADLLAAERATGFDPTRAPLARLTLIRVDDRSYHFVLNIHHVLVDGWSLGILFAELAVIYHDRSAGRPLSLPPARPFVDYIRWLERQDHAAAEAFWRGRLRGFDVPTGLPGSADAAGSAEGARYGQQETRIEPQLADALAQLARQRHVTVNTVMEALWGTLLSAATGSADVVFGTTVAGRPEDLAGVESMVGLFISTLPTRVRTTPDLPFWEAVSRLQAEQSEMRQYDYCGAGEIHEWSEVPLSVPLYETVLVFENYPRPSGSSAVTSDDAAPATQFFGGRTRHALTVLVSPGAGLLVQAVHDRRRLGDSAVLELLHRLHVLTADVVRSPDVTLAELVARLPAHVAPGVGAWDTARQPAVHRPHVAPRTPTEEALAHICADVLGLESVSMADNFFDLGGHSLLVTRLTSRLRTAFGVNAPPQLVFESSSMADMAAGIEDLVLREVEALSEEEAGRLLETGPAPDGSPEGR